MIKLRMLEKSEKCKRLFASTVVLGTLLYCQSCTVGPNYQPPDLSGIMQESWQEKSDEQTSLAQEHKPEAEWWRQFHDDHLTHLIQQLYASSRPLAQARERIVEMNARQGVVGADRRLQLAAALGYTHAETGDDVITLQAIPPGQTLNVYSTGLTAGWELDLWGRVTRLLEAGEQDILSSHADYQAIMVSLAAELTLSYIQACTLHALADTTRESVILTQKTLELALSRFEAGNGSELEVIRTRRLLNVTQARLPELARGRTVAENRIKELIGLPPDVQIHVAGTPPDMVPIIGVGMPADLITRRPDIRNAVHRYHGAVARIGAAEAEKYPSLTISGTLTLSSDSMGSAFDSDALIYTLGPGFRFPLLTGKRIESNIAVRRSQAEQQRLALEQQILSALAEVENAATGVVRSQQRTKELAEAEHSAAKSVALADELYRAGLGDLFQVLDNQQQLINIQESLLLARQQALAETVALYRALGGGWESAMAAQSNTE